MTRDVRAANEAAWNLVAAKFAPDVARDVEFLRSGGSSLLPVELDELPPLVSGCRRAIHLQCSHGMDALSLWRLGAREIVGVDLAAEMLALARRKSDLLGAPAVWHHADVLSPPRELGGTADLVYTGKGALCWVSDLARWAEVVARLLAPGGHFYVFEGHPLNWLWEPEAADLELRAGASYFDREPRPNRDFPGLWLEQAARVGESPAQAFEHHWSLGEIVSALARAGLALVSLREHAQDFWPQLPRVPAERAGRMPHSFSLSMRAPA